MPVRSRDPQHVGNDLALLLQTVIVDLQKETILAENVLILGSRASPPARIGPARRFAETSPFRHADSPISPSLCSRKKFFIDARLVIETFEISLRNQLDEILVSLFVFAQHDQVIRPAGWRDRDRCRLVFEMYISQPMIGLTPALRRGFIEADRAEQIAMIGDGNGRHFVFRSCLGERVMIAGAVEQAETGMQMKMNEVRHRRIRVRFESGYSIPIPIRSSPAAWT